MIFLAAGFFVFRHDAFWITDGGNKFMVAENYLLTGSTAFAERPFFPDAVFHFQHHRGVIRSIFPEYFAVISAYFYRWFGLDGLFVLPLAGGIAAVALCARLLRRWKLPDWLVLALALATPLAFYSWTFWEMTLGAALVLAALLVCRKHWLPAGLLLGLGLWMRSESYFILAACLAVLALDRDWRAAGRLLAGFALAALPLWLYQYREFDHVLGLHGSLYLQHNEAVQTLGAKLLGRLGNYRYYLASFTPDGDGVLQLLLLAAAGLGLAGREFNAFRQAKIALAAILGAVWLWQLIGIVRSPEPVIATIFSVGLLTSQPYLWLVLLNLRPLWHLAGRYRVLTRLVIVAALLIPPLLTSSDLGIIWGPRHFLALLPAGLMTAALAARRMRVGWLLVVLLALSTLLQIHGWRTLALMKENTATLESTLRREVGPVAVTDVYFLPLQTPRLFFEKEWLFAAADRSADDIRSALRSHGIDQFTLVVAADTSFRRLSNPALKKLTENGKLEAAPVSVKLPGTKFLEVHIFRFRF
ncbi:MAG: hypothetical protein AB7F32_06740 [Victivallaceae bacterium]